jgi:hypothetical protein
VAVKYTYQGPVVNTNFGVQKQADTADSGQWMEKFVFEGLITTNL